MWVWVWVWASVQCVSTCAFKLAIADSNVIQILKVTVQEVMEETKGPTTMPEQPVGPTHLADTADANHDPMIERELVLPWIRRKWPQARIQRATQADSAAQGWDLLVQFQPDGLAFRVAIARYWDSVAVLTPMRSRDVLLLGATAILFPPHPTDKSIGWRLVNRNQLLQQLRDSLLDWLKVEFGHNTSLTAGLWVSPVDPKRIMVRVPRAQPSSSENQQKAQ